MIKAKEALTLSESGKAIKAIMDNCDRAIRKAAAEGRTCCAVQIRNDTKDEIRSYIRKELEDLGYRCSLGMYKQMPPGCPQEQWGYYDDLTIVWEGAK